MMNLNQSFIHSFIHSILFHFQMSYEWKKKNLSLINNWGLKKILLSFVNQTVQQSDQHVMHEWLTDWLTQNYHHHHHHHHHQDSEFYKFLIIFFFFWRIFFPFSTDYNDSSSQQKKMDNYTYLNHQKCFWEKLNEWMNEKLASLS